MPSAAFVLLAVFLVACAPEPDQISSSSYAGSAGMSAEPVPVDLSIAPPLLSQTGFFANIEAQPFEPKYPLWSDGAVKHRWVQLPAGAQIDTSNMDAWRYPVGTKLWKQFAKDGRAIETRYMVKHGPDSGAWTFMAYQWNEAATDAVAVPYGVSNAAGTQHDIPSALTCLECHKAPRDGALGLSAIQLSHAAPGVTLSALIASARLSHPPAGDLTVPGDPIAQAALGYLHGNCGSCHVMFWQSAAQLASVEQTTTYASLVTNTNGDLSVLMKSVARMRLRPEWQMPPIATELVDEQGVATVDAWLQQLLFAHPQP
jgi:hypothetical protein